MREIAALIEQLAPGARIERSWPLTGGVSASVRAVALVRPDGAREQVVLRHLADRDRDWEDAAAGDPLSDLTCARAELSCAAGEAAADAFTERYLRDAPSDTARLPVWDLYVSTAALRFMDGWGLAPDVLAARRQATTAFRARARRALGR